MRSSSPPSTQRQDSVPLVLSTALFCIAIAAQVIVAWKFWGLTWDDSAITLGFARTLAMTGRIEPTPHSGIVEGYSTTLWMLLMTAVAKLVSNPSTLLAAAKLGSLALNILSLFLMRAWFSTWMPKVLGTLAAGIFGCSFMFYETINGMETPLVLALIFAMLLLQRSSERAAGSGYLVAGSALILTRWEAVLFVVPFVLLERRFRNAFVSAVTWGATFIAVNVVRRLYFGAFLPNTITAKHGAPYLFGSRTEQLQQHMGQPLVILAACWYFVLVIVIYLLYQRFSIIQFYKKAYQSFGFRLAIVLLLFSVVLTIAIGFNWGPPLRSFYSGWPFLFAVLLSPLAPEASPPRTRSFSLAVAALFVLSLYRMDRVINELRVPYAPVYMPGATVNSVAEISDILGKIQLATGHHDLLFAGPDMGGVILFSEGVRVIDLGLLCDRTMARERFAAFEPYVLQDRKPDVIEVHGMWTTLTEVVTSSRFHRDYRPLVVNGRRVFIRKELLKLIAPARLQEMKFPTGSDPDDDSFNDFATKTIIIENDEDDIALNVSFGTYLQLD